MKRWEAKSKGEKERYTHLNSLAELEGSDVTVYLTGGKYSDKRECLIGRMAEEQIMTVYADKFFFSARAVSAWGEITDISEDEIGLRRMMLKNSRKSYFLCDSSKLDSVSSFHLFDVEETDGIICDCEVKFESRT